MQDWLVSVAAWWGGTALGGGLVLLLGCVLMRRTREPAVRQRVGEVAIIAALLVAVLRMGPAWISLPWPSLPTAQAAEPFSATTMPAELATYVLVSPQTDLPDIGRWQQDAPAASNVQNAVEWTGSLLLNVATAVYLSIVAAFLLRWMLGQWSLARLRQTSMPASRHARGLFARMAGRRLWPRPRLGLSRRLALPIAFGLRRPAVLLPDGFDHQADETTLRWVFAHELTHLRRRDPWSYWAVGLAQAVYFYVPWFWWIKRQVRLCQEYVADAAAAREGAAADDYAEFLVSLAKSPATPLGAAGLGSTSDLFRRVQMVLQTSSRGPDAGSRRPAFFTMTGLLAAALLASGFGIGAEPSKPKAKTGGDDIELFELIGDLKIDQPDGVEIFTLVTDDDDKDARKDKKKEEKKGEKKRVIVVQQDGKNIITIPADADVEEVKKQVEKAMVDAKRQAAAARKAEAAAREAAEVARNAEAAARDKARAAADKARRAAEEAREKARKDGAETRERFRAVAPVVAFAGEGRLGVRVEKPSAAMADQLDLPKGRGLVVVELSDDSPAGKAGVKVNDVILEFKGNAVPSDAQRFIRQLRENKDDDTADVIVLRKGHKEKIRGIKLREVKSGEGGAVWQVQPGSGVWTVQPKIAAGQLKDGGTWTVQPRTVTGVFKDGKFEWKMDKPKDGDKGEKGDKKDRKYEFKLDGVPQIEGKDMKFDIQFDGMPGVDGKKISEDVKKQIERKMKALKEVQGKELSDDLKKQIELKMKAVTADGKKLTDDAKKRLEIKLEAINADGKKLSDDVKKKIEVQMKALNADGRKLSEDVKKRIEIQMKALDADGKKLSDETKKLIELKLKALDGLDGRVKDLQKQIELKLEPLSKTGDTPKRGRLVVDGRPSGESNQKQSNVNVSVTINDGELQAVQKEDGLEITVLGEASGDKVKVREIKIYSDGEKNTYRSIDDVPSKYRGKVKKLISNQEGSPVRFRFEKQDN